MTRTSKRSSRARPGSGRRNFFAPAKVTPPLLLKVYARQRLYAWLDESASPFVWIEGPAGAGKTTLAAGYLKACKRQILWYQVDAGDQDPATFFHYFGRAIAFAAPRHRRPMPSFRPEYLGGLDAFAQRYFEEIDRRLPSNTTIVFDNLQEVDADRSLHAVLHAGLDRLNPERRVLLLSRGAPPATYARLRANGRLTVLGWEWLRLTQQEAGGIVAMHTRTGSQTVKAFHEHTRGWVAGLILLLQGADIRSARRLSSDESATQKLFDYFAGEIFDRRDLRSKTFLMQTALFSSFTADMAEALTGDSRAAKLLKIFVAQHDFIESRTQQSIVYQYHPLFREFLTKQLFESVGAAEILQLRQRAATLLEQNGRAEEALQMYLESDDTAAVARLVLREAENFMATGRFRVLQRIIDSLPAAMLEREPWLLYWRGSCRVPLEPAEGRLDLARAYTLFGAHEEARSLYLTWAAIVESFSLEFRDFAMIDKWIAEFYALRARYPTFPSFEVEARVVLAAVFALSIRYVNCPGLEELTERAETIMRLLPDGDQRYLAARFVTISYHFMGKADRVRRILNEIPRQPRAVLSPLVLGIWKVVLSIFEWQQGDPAVAERMSEETIRIGEEYGIWIGNYQAILQRLYASLVCSNVAGADRYLEQMRLMAIGGRVDTRLYHHCASMTALHRRDLLTAYEHSEEALRLSEKSGIRSSQFMCRWVSALVALLRDDVASADALLAKAREITEMCASKWLLHYFRLLEAVFALERGERAAAVKILRDALALSRELYGPSVPWLPHDLLGKLYAFALEHNIETDHVIALIRRFRMAPPDSASSSDAWPFRTKIYTLGRFQVVIEGKPLRFAAKAQKKPLALLKALIALGGRDVREERLAETLWPDLEADAGLAALKTAVHRLRHLIGEETIERQEGKLTLARLRCWVDLWAIERLLDDLEQSCRRQDVDEITVCADRLLNRYHGAFLENEPEASWVLSARERLRSQVLRRLEAAARRLIHCERHEQAIECYRRGLEIEPLTESFYGGLMQSYLSTDRQSEALQTYNRCQRTLKAELGVTPSAEIEKLARQIRRV